MLTQARRSLSVVLLAALLGCGGSEVAPPRSDGGTSALADGGPTIADGGPTIADGGPTIADGGPTIADGGPTIADGGPTIADGGPTIADGGPTIADGGPTIADGGPTIADGGPTIADGGPVTLAPPAGVVGGGSDTMNVIIWNASQGATGYMVLRSLGSGALTPISGSLEASKLSYVDLNVSVGTSYRYQVVALSSGGDIAPAAAITVIARGVAATGTATLITDSSNTVFPLDLRNSRGLRLLHGSGSNFTTVLPVATTDGYLVFPGVPSDTTYYFCSDPASTGTLGECSVTANRALDFSLHRKGRLDVGRATIDPTNVTISLTGLNPWDASTNWLDLLSLGAGNTYGQLNNLAPPSASATSFSAVWNLARGWNLFAGDQVFITQLERQVNSAGWSYYSATRVFNAPLTIANGRSASLGGTMTAAPTLSLSVQLKSSLFTSHMAAVSPAARLTGTDAFAVFAAPSYGESGYLGVAGYMGGEGYPQDGTDRNVGAVTLGKPFPASWDVFVGAGSSFGMSITLPGATTPLFWQPDLMRQDLLANLPMTDLRPLVSPPQQPRLNGFSAFAAPAGGVGATPTFSWSPPSLGTPTQYEVLVYRLSLNGSGAVEATQVLRLVTAATSVQVPPGVLVSGTTYFAQLSAQLRDVSALTSPFRMPVSNSHAKAVTHTFTP